MKRWMLSLINKLQNLWNPVKSIIPSWETSTMSLKNTDKPRQMQKVTTPLSRKQEISTFRIKSSRKMVITTSMKALARLVAQTCDILKKVHQILILLQQPWVLSKQLQTSTPKISSSAMICCQWRTELSITEKRALTARTTFWFRLLLPRKPKLSLVEKPRLQTELAQEVSMSIFSIRTTHELVVFNTRVIGETKKKLEIS